MTDNLRENSGAAFLNRSFFSKKTGTMKEHISKKEILDTLTPVVENTAMRYNLIPLEISLEKENGHWFLRIFIYSANHPVSHQDCEHITRGLGDFLDELIPFKYYLEVSSPGLNRKMKSAREYIIFKGKDIIIKIKNPIEGIEGKTQRAVLVDYLENEGLKILFKEQNLECIVPLDNIFSVRLDEDININNQNKGENND